MASLIAVSVSYVQVLSKKCRKAGKKNEIACLLKQYNNDLPGNFKFQAGISKGGSQELILLVLQEAYGYDKGDGVVQASSETAQLQKRGQGRISQRPP